ncbi:MAG: hypothetical protein V7K48_16815 [Nostoc sp.]|uniref:hypothetical protein n=1 Tax=Nostoc sp. TaxID=1180 RepID=UPI002FFAF6CD
MLLFVGDRIASIMLNINLNTKIGKKKAAIEIDCHILENLPHDGSFTTEFS